MTSNNRVVVKKMKQLIIWKLVWEISSTFSVFLKKSNRFQQIFEWFSNKTTYIISVVQNQLQHWVFQYLISKVFQTSNAKAFYYWILYISILCNFSSTFNIQKMSFELNEQ